MPFAVRAWCACASAFLLCSAIRPASAIVDIEDLRVEKPEPGFSGRLALAADGQSGNTDKSAISFGTRLQWYHEPATDFIVVNYDVAETDGVKDTDRSFLHARHIQDFSERHAWEAFGQVQKDKFTRLSSRELLGGGLRFGFLRGNENLSLIAGAGAFVERERLEEAAGTTDAGSGTLARWNTYLVVKYRINDNVRVASTTYFQPATSDFQDYRALEQAALLVKLTGSLDLKLSLNVARDNRPPQLVKKTDTTYRTGIEYRF